MITERKRLVEENRKKLNKRLTRNIAVSVFAIALLVIGFTLAYFSKRDEATNQFSSESYEIKLFEQNWNGGGITTADKLEPGNDISKDPSVMNASQDDVYIRVKLEFILGDNSYTLDQIATGESADHKRLQKILGSIYRFDNSSDPAFLVPFFTTDNVASGENRLYIPKLTDNRYSSTNPRFYYNSDGWFYFINEGASFTGSANADNVLTAVNPGASTVKLFDELFVPVLKDEFYGSFDKPFSIKVTAQGTPIEKDAKTHEVVEKSLSKVISQFK